MLVFVFEDFDEPKGKTAEILSDVQDVELIGRGSFAIHASTNEFRAFFVEKVKKWAGAGETNYRRDFAVPARTVSWNYCDLLEVGVEIFLYQKDILQIGYLRGADLHHVSVASYWFEDYPEKYFATLDQSQRILAKALGYTILP